MAKKYRVISAAGVAGNIDQAQVVSALQAMGIKENQARGLLTKQAIIKQDLDYQKALAYQERFAKAGLLVNIQAYEAAAAENSAPDVFAVVRNALTTPFTPVKISAGYKLSVLMVLLASLIAPAIYFGILSGATWGLWWYFSEGRAAYLSGWSHNLWGIVFSFAVPAFVGAVLILFLLYPLWPQGKQPKPFVLDRKKNKQFYVAIEQLAAAAGVPAPQFIELMPEVNAAAAPTHGLLSLSQGKLRLMIGLSLVSGSNVQQLMGIIAHEFGHFAQRSGMFAYNWINRVNRWLGECAFGQDAWRERLNRWSESVDLAVVQVPLFCAHMMIAVVRWLFANLYKLSIRLTQSMSRQMEFDADRYEAQLVGSATFRANTMNIRKLAYAWQYAMQVNSNALHGQDKLLRNIPAAVIHIAEQFPPQFLKQMEDDLYGEQTHFWDSHPADLDRINHAERAQEPGRLVCTEPAHRLFNDFDTLCEQISSYFYYQHGISGAKEFVVDNAELLPATA